MSETATGWQPIETAPRDGSKVMIWLVRRETIAWAQWKDADKCYGSLTDPARWEWQEGSVVSWVPDRPGAVSHWAPLEPPPPTGGHHSRHTPGPWRYYYTSAAQARAQAQDGTDGGGAAGSIQAGPLGMGSTLIAFALHHRDPSEDAFREANLRLMAAAPDLLEALREALHLIETTSPIEGDAVRRARLAIDKATGNLTIDKATGNLKEGTR